MIFDELLEECDKKSIVVKEKHLRSCDGRISNNKIAIRKDIPTVQKTCVLAEELGHYHTTVGNILDQSIVENRKQEKKARVWAYRKLITLDKILDAFLYGCRNRYEAAEYMGVTEEFLAEALVELKSRRGPCFKQGDYIVFFEPTFAIMRMF